jgi:hypothetical protein
MQRHRILAGAMLLSLMGCAAPLKQPPQTQPVLQEALLALCPAPVARSLPVNEAMAAAYLEALAGWAACYSRHRALSEAAQQM